MLNQGSTAADTKQVTACPGPSCISATVFVVGAHQLFLPHRLNSLSCGCYFWSNMKDDSTEWKNTGGEVMQVLQHVWYHTRGERVPSYP